MERDPPMLPPVRDGEEQGPTARTRTGWWWLVLVLVLVPLQSALALQIPSQPSGRVTDLPGLLPPAYRQDLDDRLARFERETTHQVAVLIVQSLEGESLEEVSHRVFNTWKLGQAGVGNGILVLIAVADRKIRLEVGYGLEGALPDGLAGAIIRESLAPRFRQEDYYDGLVAGLERIFTATRGADFAAARVRRTLGLTQAVGVPLAWALVVGLGILGAIHYLARRFPGRLFWISFVSAGVTLLAGTLGLQVMTRDALEWWAWLGLGFGICQMVLTGQYACPRCNGWLDKRSDWRGWEFLCPACGFKRIDAFDPRPAWRSASESDGSSWCGGGGWFGGGGGSGGGGASGGW